MVKILRASDSTFNMSHADYLAAHDVQSESRIDLRVQEIIADVKARGDGALVEYTKTLDRVEVDDASSLRVPMETIDQAYASIDMSVRKALEKAALRIRQYHQKQMPNDLTYTDDQDITLGNLWRSVEVVGMYVPGGRASYPSSVLMNAIPARVAGVDRLVMVVPTPGGEINPVILAAAKIAGVDEIYTIGGAQAVAALSFGTQTIPKVDVVVGPGNAYVASAKRQLFGTVGIDMVAGPSEILVIADGTYPADWVAADLLSQAEHDPMARAILVATNEAYANEVIAAVGTQLNGLSRKEDACKSWDEQSAVYVVESLDQAITIANDIAPEHLELMVKDPTTLIDSIRHAGAIFVGGHTPEAIGDYMAGPSHVLPTSGTARYSSGLSVYDFLKRVSLIHCSEQGFESIAEATELLAGTEGLDAHSHSIRIRRTTSS